MAGRVEGKVALITGGARGQGAAHGALFAREGAKVVVADVLDEEGEALAKKLSKQDLSVSYTHLDVSDKSDWEAAVRFTEDRYGPVTVLVNNAGVSSRGGGPSGIENCSLEDWHRVVAINQTGVFLGMQAVIPGMRASGGGSIVNTASDWAHTGGAPNRGVAYVSSKAAVLGMTRNAALSLAADGIRVNSLSPGAVLTPMVGDPDAVHREIIERTPMKRAAQPIEMSYVALFLASDEASYVTGADFLAEGGLHTV